MKNRMISYGYGVRNGEISIIDSEAEIVKRIFKEYIDGKLLKNISDELLLEKVPFYFDNYIWNKNKIARIIENKKYIGENDYPSIINKNDFKKACQIKEEKGVKKIQQPKKIECIRDIVYCSQCGKPMRRISKWRSREKWLCRNGCKNEIYISDKEIFDGIYQIAKRIYDNPDIIKSKDNLGYRPTEEIEKQRRNINRMLSTKEPVFNVCKKNIFEFVKLKFLACTDVSLNIYDDIIIKETMKAIGTNNIDENYINKVISRIEIDKEGCVILKFKNGLEIKSEVNCNDKWCEETYNEDKCESFA